MKSKRDQLLLLTILIIGALLRFNKLNWDNNQHLHPDERFLIMVANAMEVPGSFTNYLNPRISTFNPRNLGFNFFVYGSFPLILTKLLAVKFNYDDYNNLTLLGRFLAAGADLLVIVVIYKTIALLENSVKWAKKTVIYLKSVKVWASLFYATAVLPIQLGHFFTADPFLNFFTAMSLYFALHYFFKPKLKWLMFSSLFLGLATATKINALVFLPLNLLIISSVVKKIQKAKKVMAIQTFKAVVKTLIQDLPKLILYLIFCYFTLRIADPNLFANANLLKPIINPNSIDNLKSLRSWQGRDVWYPPAVQWINKASIIYALKNIVWYGLGWFHSLVVLIGLVYLIKLGLKYPKKSLLISLGLAWLTAFYIYQSSQFVKALRYFIFIYPLLAMVGGLGLTSLMQTQVRLPRFIKVVGLVIGLAIWPLMFSSIYFQEHSRITASKWIYRNISSNSLILTEHWDDGLPLILNSYPSKKYLNQSLPVFNPDTTAKWQQFDLLLQQADYYILSSNRGWGSIPTVPEKYPQMARFYQDLLAGKLDYQKVAEFSSYPSLNYLGIPWSINDDWADETFTVYDHPKVLIFKNINRR